MQVIQEFHVMMLQETKQSIHFVFCTWFSIPLFTVFFFFWSDYDGYAGSHSDLSNFRVTHSSFSVTHYSTLAEHELEAWRNRAFSKLISLIFLVMLISLLSFLMLSFFMFHGNASMRRASYIALIPLLVNLSEFTLMRKRLISDNVVHGWCSSLCCYATSLHSFRFTFALPLALIACGSTSLGSRVECPRLKCSHKVLVIGVWCSHAHPSALLPVQTHFLIACPSLLRLANLYLLQSFTAELLHPLRVPALVSCAACPWYSYTLIAFGPSPVIVHLYLCIWV